EGLEDGGVDELALPCPLERLEQEGVDRPREIEAPAERHGKGREAPQQPAPELDQMLEERRAGLVYVVHGSSRGGGGGSGSSSCGGSLPPSPGSPAGSPAGAGSASTVPKSPVSGCAFMIRSFSSLHRFSSSSSSDWRIISSMPERKWRAMPR